MFSVLAVIVTTGVSLIFVDRALRFLLVPAGDAQIVFTHVTGMIGVYFSMALVMGVAAAIPFVLFQIVRFVAPALYPREKKLAYSLLPAALVAFAGGVVFGYYVLLPPSLKFLLNFGSDIAVPMIDITGYVSLVERLLFALGAVFETPVVVYILAMIGILTARKLIKWWRWAIIGAFLIGAIITPTFDPVNQTIVAVPLVALYVLSIGLAYMAELSRKKRKPS